MSPPDSVRGLRDVWQTRERASDDLWPVAEWTEICSAGITRWTIPKAYGGSELAAAELVNGCLELARGQLLATFVLSQFQAACQRMVLAESVDFKRRWLPELAQGNVFATVGISHLTTSRQHTVPAVVATPLKNGDYCLTGEIPWVTGCRHAAVIVIGGTMADGRQILAAVPADRLGVEVGEPMQLLALTGSETGSISLREVLVLAEEVLAGPVERVVQQSATGGAGSWMTSTLAAGHALKCLDYLRREAQTRESLTTVVQALSDDVGQLHRDLVDAAEKRATIIATPEQLRTRATDLALRCSQAILTASKGAGFLVGHPVERLAREALFFLVWSCPQAVANQLLQGFGGCETGL